MNPSRLCSAESGQLVVIDVQARLAGAMPAAARERVVKNSGILLQAAALLQVPATVTEQYPKGLGATEEALAARFTDQVDVTSKTCFACSGADGFNQALDERHDRQQLIVAGMETHVCVLQSALELQNRGYQVFVVEDAVCSRSEANHRNALARLRGEGIVVTNTESVLFEWLRDASHPQFRTISALIK